MYCQNKTKYMTKEQLIEKMNILFDSVTKGMTKDLEKLLASGAVDYESADNDFLLPRKILQAILKEEQFQHKPLSEDRKTKKEIESYYAMI